jgi:hypothetical protein
MRVARCAFHYSSDDSRRHKGRQNARHPVPSVVMKFLQTHVERVLEPEVGTWTG